MALHIFTAIISRTVPSRHYLSAVLAILVIAIVHAYSQGRRTNRDRDLHARIVILTGAFTPLGLTLLEFLAKRGAHVIALVPSSSLTSHQAEVLSLLRDTTSNQSIYAEPCPLNSPKAIKKFCEQFASTENEKDRRVDALIMTHEYGHIGTWGLGIGQQGPTRMEEEKNRDEASMATFLLTTLLLPALLVAPVDRDIRIINIVNPFYAAASPAFVPKLSSLTYTSTPESDLIASSVSDTATTPDKDQASIWVLEGQRALRMAVFTRHLQRILDALPDPSSITSPINNNSGSSSNSEGPKKAKPQPSNILAVTVSPGLSRTDTVAPYILSRSSSYSQSVTKHWLRTILYIILLPVLHLLTKTPTSALQTVLHVLCVPKPVTRRRIPSVEDPAQLPSKPSSQPQLHITAEPARQREEEEVLVPGALYTDCSIVRLDLRAIPGSVSDRGDVGEGEAERFDLGLGDEPLGRTVWEALERGIKIWERREKEEAQKKENSRKE